MENIYWIIGFFDSYDSCVKIYNGGYNSDMKFVKLGYGLGKAYKSKKQALKRIEIMKTYIGCKRDYRIYKVTTNIEEDILEI